jgi:DNA-binding response OmpR family regulator
MHDVDGSGRTEQGTPQLVLVASERRLRGFEMTPLLSGELLLLRYLGSHPNTWHSSYRLSVQVYNRQDATGRQLVWKYASTLRKKLAAWAPGLIEMYRGRGYNCRMPIEMLDEVEAP